MTQLTAFIWTQNGQFLSFWRCTSSTPTQHKTTSILDNVKYLAAHTSKDKKKRQHKKRRKNKISLIFRIYMSWNDFVQQKNARSSNRGHRLAHILNGLFGKTAAWNSFFFFFSFLVWKRIKPRAFWIGLTASQCLRLGFEIGQCSLKTWLFGVYTGF